MTVIYILDGALSCIIRTETGTDYYVGALCRLFLIPVYQAHKPHALAHKWFYEFGTRHNMSIKAGRKLRDMRML